MKKLFALLAVALGVVACQKDQADFGVNLGGEQEVTINVALSAETRASSALGSLENGVTTTHDLRYILEIYQGEHCLRMEKFTTEDNVAFPVRLAPGREYNFVVWADFVKKEGARNAEDADEYYETSAGLDSISMIKGTPMDEARDAFYGKATLAAGANLASLSTIELTRPFAKIRVVTTDVQDLANIGVALPTEATVTYANNVVINNKFNAFTGEASSDANAVKTYTFNYANTYDVENGEMTLFADYLFVNANATTKFNLDIKDFESKPFTTEIPVVANQITTIKGDILTNGGDINIDINDKFDAETIYLEGDVTLTENLNVNRPLVVAAGKTAVLNLNGYNIINTNPSENFGEGEGIIAYGDLTIKGNGTVKGSTMAVWARGTNNNNHVTITIEGGNFEGCAEGFAKGGRSVVYASSGNVINIKGGTFKALAADKSSYANKTEGVFAALNVADNNGMINVFGGSFYKQNPAAPGTEPAAWNANHPNGFLAEGCVAEADGDLFKVKYDPYYYHTKVSTADEFKAELEKGTSKIFLNSGNYEGTFQVKHNVNIVGADNAKIIGRVEINLATATFENVKFATNDASKAAFTLTGWSGYQYEAIVGVGTSGSASFDKCSFDYQDTSAITNANGFIKVTNCDFVGNSQFAIYSRANIEITDSTVKVTVPNGYESIAGFIHLNALAYGKATVKNIKGSCHNGADMGHPICFGGTNNDANGIWVGPVTFDVQGNTGFTYSFYKLGSVTISHEDHIFADGSKKFTWTY